MFFFLFLATSSLFRSRRGFLRGEPLGIELLNPFNLKPQTFDQERISRTVITARVRNLYGDDNGIAGPVDFLIRLDLESGQELVSHSVRVGT